MPLHLKIKSAVNDRIEDGKQQLNAFFLGTWLVHKFIYWPGAPEQAFSYRLPPSIEMVDFRSKNFFD